MGEVYTAVCVVVKLITPSVTNTSESTINILSIRLLVTLTLRPVSLTKHTKHFNLIKPK
jgi:hypothetical protein